MKVFVRQHFEEFVNRKKAEVIRHNMTPDFYDHDGPDGKAAGVEEDERMMRRMYELMPDLQSTSGSSNWRRIVRGSSSSQGHRKSLQRSARMRAR